MEPPKPSDELKMDSWGLIFALDANNIYWFETAYSMIGFLYLGCGIYLGHQTDEWHGLDLTEMRLESRVGQGLTAFQNGEKRVFAAEVKEVNEILKPYRQLMWWGQAKELAFDNEPFALQLRQDFLLNQDDIRDLGERTFDADEFLEWLEQIDEESMRPWVNPYEDADAPLKHFTPPREGFRNDGGVWTWNV